MNWHIFPISFIATVSMALYANTLGNGFVYDDVQTIVNNTFIRDLYNLPAILEFKKDYYFLSQEMSYRPVVTLTYFLDYTVFGLNAWGFHLTNILLHALNGILLYTFMALLVKGPVHDLRPFLASLLFAMHPVLTEAVNAVSYREDLLMFTFYITTLNIYSALSRYSISRHSSILYIFSCFLYLLALLSKEMAISLPLIAFCYASLYHNNKKKSVIFNPRILGYAAIAIAYLYVRTKYFYHPLYRFSDPVKSAFADGNITERLLAVPLLLLNYIKLAFFPVSLSADYAVSSVKSIFSGSFLIPIVTLSCLLTLLLIKMQKRKEVIFGILIFFITLIPVCNIFPLDRPFAERYFYLPMAGFAIVSGYLIHGIATAGSDRIQKKLVALSFFIIAGIYSASVIMRNNVWTNEYTLWSDTVKKQPTGVAYTNLGIIYYNQENFYAAINLYRAAISIDPMNSYAYNNLGLALLNKGQSDDAIMEFKSAIRLKPDYAEAYNNLGAVYLWRRQYNEAIQAFKSATQLKQGYFKALLNLGIAYYETGNFDEALFQLRAALKLNPADEKALDYFLRIQQAKGI